MNEAKVVDGTVVKNDESKKISMVEKLINYIDLMIQYQSPLLSVIDHPKILISALKDLDSLIEMHDLKKMIVQLIEMLIITAYTRVKTKGKNVKKFDSHLLHICICGPPGVGKSYSARHIAKVYYALGIMDQMSKNTKKDVVSLPSELTKTYNQQFVFSKMNYDLSDTVANEAGEILMDVNTLKSILADFVITLGPNNVVPISDALSLLTDNFGLRVNNIIGLCQPMQNSESLPELMPAPVEEDKENGHKKEYKEIEDGEIPVMVVGRADLIGQYSGHTSIQTLKVLNSAIGKVLIIEEAYLLYTGDKDLFGQECLGQINKFMDEHSDEIIIIMLGYKKLMEECIFKIQVGIKSRMKNIFSIKGYTSDGVAKIFLKQLKESGWELDKSIDINKFFKDNFTAFRAFGRDTYRLVLACKIAYTSLVFNDLCTDLLTNKEGINIPEFVITNKMLLEGFKDFQSNDGDSSSKDNSPPYGMFV